jgi:hypothetical protein
MKQTVQELHKQHKLDDSPIELYLVHKFDSTTKTWKFSGYRCVYCGSSFKHETTIHKHRSICKELTKPNKRSYGADNPELVITTKGSVWKPLSIYPE